MLHMFDHRRGPAGLYLCCPLVSNKNRDEQTCAASYIFILVETGSKEAASVRMRSLNLAAIICSYSLPILSFLQLRVDCVTMYLTYILRFYKKGTKMYLCF